MSSSETEAGARDTHAVRVHAVEVLDVDGLLAPLMSKVPGATVGDPLTARVSSEPAASVDVSGLPAVVVGELVGFRGAQPLVVYPGRPSASAVVARTTVDLHAGHVGRAVVLAFEGGHPARPIVTGWLRDDRSSAEVEAAGALEVDVDGERMTVVAKSQLVLRCGQASITLTSAGKVLIEGRYVSSRSAGVNRIKGGSVQIN